jgi:hypothetical protein
MHVATIKIYRRDSNGSATDDINFIITSPFCGVRYRGRTSENYTGNSVIPYINAVE